MNAFHTPGGEWIFGGEDRPTSRHGQTRSEFWSLPIDGSKPRLLSSRIVDRRDPVLPYAYSISAGGTVAATASTRRGFAVVVFDPDTGSTRIVVPKTAQKEGSLEPAISPDGKEIVYKVDKQKGPADEGGLISTDVMIVPAAGGKPRLLARVRGGASWPGWDPSGSRITFTAPTDRAVMEVNPDGTCLSRLLRLGRPAGILGASWQPGPGRGAGPISC